MMKTYVVTGLRHGIQCTIAITSKPECVVVRATQHGMSNITYVEER
jgi:hypothetical protein